MKLLQRIGAVLAGVLAGGLMVTAIEGTSSFVYPMPSEIDPNNADELAGWIGELPMGAFIFVLAAWASGCCVGTFVARRFAPNRSALCGVLVWGFFTIASISMMIMIPHPLWFWFAAIAVCLIFGLVGLLLAAPSAYIVRTERIIAAPIEKVFSTLATAGEFANAVPGITKIEILTDKRYGVGTRFRETRVMNGKDASTELEVTELVENERIRMVSDAGGTIWDTVFTVAQSGNEVEMTMEMEARPHRFLARFITPMILPMVGKFVAQDMDSIKDYCQ